MKSSEAKNYWWLARCHICNNFWLYDRRLLKDFVDHCSTCKVKTKDSIDISTSLIAK